MTAWLLGNMAWASALALLVLLIRRPVAALCGAGAAYALWLLPALRLLAPPLPDLSPSLPAVIVPVDLAVAAGDSAALAPPDGGPGQWVPILLAIWAGGAALFLVRQWLVYRAFLRRLSLASRSAGAHRGLPLIESAAVDGPLALGLLDRRIVVPADFSDRYSDAERRLALEHEFVHHRRGDIWWNHLALLMLAANWFNPIAWIAFYAFRADQELACDAAVAARAEPRERHAYATALVKSASRTGLIAACPLNRADQLKRRLKMLKNHRSSRTRRLGGVALFGSLALASLALTGPIHAQQSEPKQQRREQIVIIEEHGEGAPRTAERERVQVRECEPGGELADINEGNEQNRFRLRLCGRAGASPAQNVEMLERARARIADNEQLSAGTKERVLQTLDRRIAELRSR